MYSKLKIGLLFLALSWSFFSFGQFNFNINIETGVDTLFDIGFKCIQLNSGKYLACGRTASLSSTYRAAYLVKTEINGDTLWKKQFDFAPTGVDIFTGLKELPDKNYIVLGTTYDSTIQNSDVPFQKIIKIIRRFYFKSL